MLATLDTFHFEISELKLLARLNTAETKKEREREREVQRGEMRGERQIFQIFGNF